MENETNVAGLTIKTKTPKVEVVEVEANAETTTEQCVEEEVSKLVDSEGEEECEEKPGSSKDTNPSGNGGNPPRKGRNPPGGGDDPDDSDDDCGDEYDSDDDCEDEYDEPEKECNKDFELEGKITKKDIQDLKFLTETLNKHRDDIRKLKDIDEKRVFGRAEDDIPLPKFPKNAKYKSLDKAADYKLVEFNFPRNKFTGKKGSDVREFLTMMKQAQSYCPVTPREFRRVLVSRLAAPALGMVNKWMEDPTMTVKAILCRMYDTFGENIVPKEARDCCKVYEAPESFSFSKMLSELQFVAGHASRGHSNSEGAKLLDSLLVQDALAHGLPVEAHKLVYNKTCEIRDFLGGREPDVTQLINGLSKIKREVNNEMKLAKNFTWGREREDFITTQKLGPMSKKGDSYKSKSKVTSFKTKKYSPKVSAATVNAKIHKDSKVIKEPTFVPKKNVPKPNPPMGHFKHVNNFNKNNRNNGPNNGQSKNRTKKDLCSFCGSWTHSSYDGCYAIMDDNCKRYTGAGAQEPCSICVKKLNVELTHPVIYCPLRKKMLEFYRIGKVTPRGLFKSHVERSEREK